MTMKDLFSPILLFTMAIIFTILSTEIYYLAYIFTYLMMGYLVFWIYSILTTKPEVSLREKDRRRFGGERI